MEWIFLNGAPASFAAYRISLNGAPFFSPFHLPAIKPVMSGIDAKMHKKRAIWAIKFRYKLHTISIGFKEENFFFAIPSDIEFLQIYLRFLHN